MELFCDLGLRDVSSIVGTLGRTTDKKSYNAIYTLNGVDYRIDKVNNTLVIRSSDNKEMSINVNAYEEMGKDAYNRDIKYVHHEVTVDYYLPNGDKIHLFNDIPLYEGYESFENVQRHDLMKGLRISYIPRDEEELETSYNMDLSKVCFKGSNKVYEFNNKGIVVNNRVVSSDGETLLYVSDEPVVDRAILDSFNLESEQKRIDKFLKDNPDLHPFTKEELDNASRRLTRKERYVNGINDFYKEEMPGIKKAIVAREKMKKASEECTINESELSQLANQFHLEMMGRSYRKQKAD